MINHSMTKKQLITISALIAISIIGIIIFGMSVDSLIKNYNDNSPMFKTVYKVTINETERNFGSRLPDYTRYSYNLCNDVKETAFLNSELTGRNLTCEEFMDFLGFAKPVLPNFGESFLNCTTFDGILRIEIPAGISMIRNYPFSQIEYAFLNREQWLSCTETKGIVTWESYKPIANASMEILGYYNVQEPGLDKPQSNTLILSIIGMIFSALLVATMVGIIATHILKHKSSSNVINV